jgi:hypothetical protein
MILDKNTFFQPAILAFIETLQSDQFKNRVEKIGNYNFNGSYETSFSRELGVLYRMQQVQHCIPLPSRFCCKISSGAG